MGKATRSKSTSSWIKEAASSPGSACLRLRGSEAPIPISPSRSRVILSETPLWARSRRIPWKIRHAAATRESRSATRNALDSDGISVAPPHPPRALSRRASALRLRYAHVSASAPLRMTDVRRSELPLRSTHPTRSPPPSALSPRRPEYSNSAHRSYPACPPV